MSLLSRIERLEETLNPAVSVEQLAWCERAIKEWNANARGRSPPYDHALSSGFQLAMILMIRACGGLERVALASMREVEPQRLQ